MGNGAEKAVRAGVQVSAELQARVNGLARLSTRDIILQARNSRSQPSDVTFLQWSEGKFYSTFLHEHYDWWMFPWKARPTDSYNGRRYSVLAGDVADLLLSSPTPTVADPSELLPFTQRYSASTNALFDALREGRVDPVTSAHPARKSKIFASLTYFEGVARALGFEKDADEYAALRKEFVRLFGSVETRWYADRVELP